MSADLSRAIFSMGGIETEWDEEYVLYVKV